MPDAGWNDTGGFQWERDYTEAYAQMFAFMSLVEPDPATRDQYAGRARDMLMWIMNQAALGHAQGQPFRDPLFATYNRANAMGMALPLTVDWIYGYLSADDKAAIRSVFLQWIRDCETSYPISRGPLVDPNVVNDLRLIGSSPAQSDAERADVQSQLRWVANNYWLGHQRSVTLMTLSFDPADDPGGQLTGYAASITGHWLYAAYAMFEDASVVSSGLHVPPGNKSIGLAGGGLPVEGTLYGDSLGYLSQTMLALHTAGLTDPTEFGSQVGLITSAYWDRAVDGFLHTLSPLSKVPDLSTGMSYLGPVYVPATYGDLIRDWVTWEGLQVFGPLAVLDQRIGRPDRLEAVRWILTEALEGGPEHRFDRAARIWGNGLASDSILSFLAFDPAASPPADPRPELPLTYVDRPYGRLLSRTNWGPDATWLTFKCSWMSINHQNGDCNQFELYRKGEWLTKERSGYADDMILMTSDYHNTLALQNDPPATPHWFETETIARGGQWTQGLASGDPSTVFSDGPDYVFAHGDGTSLYNRRPDAMTISHASRSLVWLKPDTVVVYDRATSISPNRFKRFNLTLLEMPTVTDRTAVQVTAGEQQLVVRTLLPLNATLTASPAEDFKTIADLEPSKARLVVEDLSNPNNVRFLHVLQAGDAAAVLPEATLVRSLAVQGSRSGNVRFVEDRPNQGDGPAPYEGVFIRATDSNAGGGDGAGTPAMLVLFQRQIGPPPKAVRYTLTTDPGTNVVHLITGLVPGERYDIGIEIAGAEQRVTVTPGGSAATADGAGVLRFVR
jgi:hypothetical protein